MNVAMGQIEIAAEGVGKRMFGAKAGVAEGHGGGNGGDAQLFQGFEIACLNAFLQMSENEVDGLE